MLKKYNLLILSSAFVFIIVTMILMLRTQSRIWWCACGKFALWNGDIWSAHNSQHLLDPYSFTHILHGMIFFSIILWLFPRMAFGWKLLLATFLEGLWEVLENTQFVIQRYREATIGIGYEGDSIVNSLGDLACSAFGFYLASRLKWQYSVLFFLAVEIALLVTVRDNLTLNILMLLFPNEAIKSWQMIH